MSKDYNPSDIRRYLSEYDQLKDGKMPVKPLKESSGYTEYTGPSIQKKVNEHAYYELPMMTKSDIDYAIQRLQRLEKMAVLLHYFRSPKAGDDDCAYWLKVSRQEFRKLEVVAVKRMTDMLNGKVERG